MTQHSMRSRTRSVILARRDGFLIAGFFISNDRRDRKLFLGSPHCIGRKPEGDGVACE